MNEDFLDLLSALNDADARFLIVGAYAVAAHGRPRATKDIDIWVISLDDLVANKTAAGRPQDIADVDALERIRRLRG